MPSEAVDCRIEVTRPARYLLSRGENARILVVALHGYGMNPRMMLDLTRKLVGDGPSIASLEAPNSFNLSADFEKTEIGYSWGTRETAWFHNDLHQRIVLGVLESLRGEHETAFLLGFSQPVGLNYRFVHSHPNAFRGVIGLCGGVPSGLDPETALPVPVLHISRSHDEYYPAQAIPAIEAKLRKLSSSVESHVLEGTHKFPLKAAGLVQSWMERVAG